MNMLSVVFSPEYPCSVDRFQKQFPSIYNGSVTILYYKFNIEFIIAPILNLLPFKFLIGRNLIDQLDSYFMGKKITINIKGTRTLRNLRCTFERKIAVESANRINLP